LSQYPYPPPPYSPPIVDPSAWAQAPPNPDGRAAGLWQLILGCLVFVGGTCVGAAIWVAPDELVMQAARQQQASLPPMQNLSLVQEIRLVFSIFSGMMLLTGGLLLLLTIFVRRGGKASTICSIVVNCLVGLFLGMSLLSDLLQVASNPMVIAPLLLTLGVLGLCIVTIAKLVVALKSSGSAQAQAMQQAYYWMMQQQAGAYGQAGYGGGYPPPPQENPAAPPGDSGPAGQPPGA
jgi:hypothetical protein